MAAARKSSRYGHRDATMILARSSGNYTERCHIKCEMKARRIDPAVPELAALSALAALGCGLRRSGARAVVFHPHLKDAECCAGATRWAV